MSQGLDIAQPLRAAQISERLGSEHPMAQSLHLLGIVNSTSDLALERGRAHRSKSSTTDSLYGQVFIAEGQRQGRGRRGTAWVSPARKGLYLSLCVQPLPSPPALRYLPLIPAVALAATLESLDFEAGLKWPNDVWLNGSKVAGTLIDLDSDADGQSFAVLGLGLNINQLSTELPALPEGTATSLLMEKQAIQSREDITAKLLRNLHHELQTWMTSPPGSPGLDSLGQSFLKRDVLVGRTITVSTAGNTLTGKLVALDPSNCMTLSTEDGQQHKLRAEHIHIQCVH